MLIIVLSPSRNCVLHPAASPQHLTSLSSHCWSQMKSSRGRVGVGTQKPGHSWKDQRPKYLFQIHRFGHNASPTSGSVISYLKEKIISTMFGAGKLISRHSIPLHWNEYWAQKEPICNLSKTELWSSGPFPKQKITSFVDIACLCLNEALPH